MSAGHRHRAIKGATKTYCYSGPIEGARENPRAHGNICFVEICKCGATREANSNWGHVEQGRWRRA